MHVKRRMLGRLEIGLMTQLMTQDFANPYKSRGLRLVSRGSSPVSRTMKKALANASAFFGAGSRGQNPVFAGVSTDLMYDGRKPYYFLAKISGLPR